MQKASVSGLRACMPIAEAIPGALDISDVIVADARSWGADLLLCPTDFHAYVEWRSIWADAGTFRPLGRDAADVAFATIFGHVQSFPPINSIEAIAGADGQIIMPHHCTEALSTDE